MKATDQLETKASADGYNKTQLNVSEDMERNVFHRDRLAHFFRWAHVMRAMKQGMSVLDLGCGTGNLAMMLYANRFKVGPYLGVDARSLNKHWSYFEGRNFDARFMTADLCKDGWQDPVLQVFGGAPQIITSFEFIEHIPGEEVEPFLLRVKQCMGRSTRFYLSTPCFDGVRKAENHIKEWYYQELKDLLEKWFTITNHWGTFISQKDLEPLMEGNEQVRGFWSKLREYYGSESLAILYAPLFPAASRNCIWQLEYKD